MHVMLQGYYEVQRSQRGTEEKERQKAAKRSLDRLLRRGTEYGWKNPIELVAWAISYKEAIFSRRLPVSSSKELSR
jgi:hypothetical protein